VELTYRDAGGLESPVPLLTDTKGRVIFYDLPSGAWHLEASYSGHLSFLAVLSVPATGKPEIAASFLQATGDGIAPTRVVVQRVKRAGERVAFDEAPRRERPEPTPTSAESPTQIADAEPAPVVESPVVETPVVEMPVAEVPVAEVPIEETRGEDPIAATVTEIEAPSVAEPSEVPAAAASASVEDAPREAAETSAADDPMTPVPTPSATPADLAPEPAEVASREVSEPIPAPSPAVVAPDAREPTPPITSPPTTSTPAPIEPASPVTRPEPVQPSVTAPPAVEPSNESPAIEERAIQETVSQVAASQEIQTPELPEPPTADASLPESTLPASEAIPESVPVPEPVIEATPQPTLQQEPVEAPAAPSVAPDVPRIAAPPRLGGSILRDPDSAEWAIAEERVVPPGGSTACPAALEDATRRAMWLIATAPELELASFAGPVDDDSGDAAIDRLGSTRRTRIDELLSPFEDSSTGCVPIAVVLPKGAQFIGFHLLAADETGAGSCEPKFDCPIGNGGWIGTPSVGRGPSSTVVYGIFKNADPARERRIRLTARFVPPSTAWAPPEAPTN